MAEGKHLCDAETGRMPEKCPSVSGTPGYGDWAAGEEGTAGCAKAAAVVAVETGDSAKAAEIDMSVGKSDIGSLGQKSEQRKEQSYEPENESYAGTSAPVSANGCSWNGMPPGFVPECCAGRWQEWHFLGR